jgi:hypothetical protein
MLRSRSMKSARAPFKLGEALLLDMASGVYHERAARAGFRAQNSGLLIRMRAVVGR